VRSAEEILFSIIGDERTILWRSDVLKAMEEYANQFKAIKQ